MRIFGSIIIIGSVALILLGQFTRIAIHISVNDIVKVIGVFGLVAGVLLFFNSGRRY